MRHLFNFKTVASFFAVLIPFMKVQGQNYNESKVPAYTLPNVLRTISGKAIKNKSSWEKVRRPEVLQLFENNVYGQFPNTYDSLTFAVTKDVMNSMNGKARLKEVTITTWYKKKSVAIHLILFIPHQRNGKSPVFLLINNRERSNTDPTRTIKSDFWPAEMLIDSGYAVAAFHVSDAAPDDKNTFQNGVLKLYPAQLYDSSGMRAVGCWAWAASRVMDYFVKDKDVDNSKVIVVGHSRGGKAALWAGAEDKRFSIVISNCSGNTGAALARRRFGETVKAINSQFPHWFTDNYKRYNNNEDNLPFDQHMLISLIAPRPVYVTSASKDLWADPKGSYQSLLEAQKVYRLYVKPSTLTPEPPPINMSIINSILGYHNRQGAHDLTAFDWRNFILFANYHFRRK